MDPAVATFVILVLAVVAFITGRVPIAVVALGVAVALWATGVLEIGQALAGFSDPTVILIACLFVVAEALDATGVTSWVGQKVIGGAGTGRVRLTVIVMTIAAALAAFISINGAVAALIPVVVVVAARADIVPSRMLIPLAFAASAGSLLTLTGTPVNLLVSETAASAGGRAFGFFEFALVGVPLVVVTVVIVVLGRNRLLPVREAEELDDLHDVHETKRTWREEYEVKTAQLQIGVAEGVAEVMIAPRSELIGRKVSPGMRTRQEHLIILAVRRHDSEGLTLLEGEAKLRAGDALLVQGPWEALDRYVRSPDVISITPPQALRRSVPLGKGAKRSLVALAIMVVLLASGLVPPVVAGLLAALFIVVTGVLPVPQVFRSIPWTVVVLIAGMIPLSTAFISTGAAGIVADLVLSWVGGASPYLALLVLCVVTLVLGQTISNVATVLVVAPIAVEIARTLDLSVLPFMMALTVVGAAAFLTPIATPANLMVMQPGGYKFGDYWRLGLPLALVYLAFAVLYVPLVWPF
ncbi:SLC13/DASS family transporter [Agromyces protaetiae]|uniref:SLC13/DASS family transporter n=1 Tax=Agromyces protaetiae TaxID=2509455 RepID=A0A4P6FBK4_9MICO|nr:SLC13 family permease [Agromyces protaetiae]QAY73650.1 SLC13/DASS family transporter [Agromyces protaetiae]